MSKLSDQLIELHVKHELERLTSSQLEADLANEIDAFLKLSAEEKLKDFVSADQIINIAHTALKMRPNIDKTLKKIILAIYEDKSHEKFTPGDLITAPELEQFLDQVLALQDMRHELIKDAIHSEIAHEIITDIVHSGIARYIALSNELTKKVPGAKAAMSLGKGILGKAAPTLEDRVEKQIKKTIRIALPDIISQSEKFITGSISDEHIKDVTLGVFNNMKDEPISGIREFFDAKDIEGLIDLALEQIRNSSDSNKTSGDNSGSDYVMALYKTGIKTFYKEYGNKKLSLLIKDLDLSNEIILELMSGILPSIITTLKDSGLLEERIRARLTDFYESKAAQELMGG